MRNYHVAKQTLWPGAEDMGGPARGDGNLAILVHTCIYIHACMHNTMCVHMHTTDDIRQLMRNYHVAKQTLWPGAEDMGGPARGDGNLACTYM